jgi:LacI family transcriptional regulator
VEEAAKALSYRPNRAASLLRSGQARIVGMLVPDLADVFFTGLISRLEVMARKDGYDVIVASSRDDIEVENSRLRALLGWRPSGLIAVPCSDTLPALLREEAGNLPMVFADRLSVGNAFADTVTIDNCQAGEIAARYLVEKGHSRILVAASSLGISPIRERVRGVRNVAEETGVEPPIVLELGSNAERGADALVNWLERNPAPTAIFALTNVTTLSVLSALARRRIDIPERTSLIGFDDYPWMSARKTPLTAISQPVDEIAEFIWQRLKPRMEGDRSPPLGTILSASLQVRDSVVLPTVAAEHHRLHDNPERASADGQQASKLTH